MQLDEWVFLCCKMLLLLFLAYESLANNVDNYVKISKSIRVECLNKFVQSVWNIF